MHDHTSPQLVQIAPLKPQPLRASPQKPHDHNTEFLVGLDVGSTTVKAVVVDVGSDRVLWQDYQRHETKQPEKTLEFLKRMETEVGIDRHNTRMFMTGSGGGSIADQIGAKFVQEVTAVSLAVEKLMILDRLGKWTELKRWAGHALELGATDQRLRSSDIRACSSKIAVDAILISSLACTSSGVNSN